MDQQDVTRFETEAPEIVGAMKELFKEFETRLGEVVSVRRVAASEARNEGAQAARQLQELTRLSKSLVDEQRNLLSRIEREWQLRIEKAGLHHHRHSYAVGVQLSAVQPDEYLVLIGL